MSNIIKMNYNDFIEIYRRKISAIKLCTNSAEDTIKKDELLLDLLNYVESYLSAQPYLADKLTPAISQVKVQISKTKMKMLSDYIDSHLFFIESSSESAADKTCKIENVRDLVLKFVEKYPEHEASAIEAMKKMEMYSSWVDLGIPENGTLSEVFIPFYLGEYYFYFMFSFFVLFFLKELCDHFYNQFLYKLELNFPTSLSQPDLYLPGENKEILDYNQDNFSKVTAKCLALATCSLFYAQYLAPCKIVYEVVRKNVLVYVF